MKKLGQELPPLRQGVLSKKSQKEEDEINIKLIEANQYCNYCKFQIHWNKLEWVNPNICDEKKNPFCVSS